MDSKKVLLNIKQKEKKINQIKKISESVSFFNETPSKDLIAKEFLELKLNRAADKDELEVKLAKRRSFSRLPSSSEITLLSSRRSSAPTIQRRRSIYQAPKPQPTIEESDDDLVLHDSRDSMGKTIVRHITPPLKFLPNMLSAAELYSDDGIEIRK
jgi:hypothetical protein